MAADSTVRADAAVSSERRRFILRYGVLGWGLPSGILFPFGVEAWRRLETGEFRWERFLALAVLSLVFFPVAGWFWGSTLWGYRTTGSFPKGVSRFALVWTVFCATLAAAGGLAALLFGQEEFGWKPALVFGSMAALGLVWIRRRGRSPA
jgi:hypothetical protein